MDASPDQTAGATSKPAGYAVVILDAAGVVQAISRAAEELLGRSAADVLGTRLELTTTSGSNDIAPLLVGSDARRLGVEVKRASTGGRPFVVVLLHKASPAGGWAGQGGGDARTAMAPGPASLSLDELRVAVAAAAPDLKYMVATSRLVSDILRDTWEELAPADRSELAARIDRESALLDRLVDWLLDVARIRRGGGLRPKVESLRLSGYLLARLADRHSALPRVRLSCPRGITVLADRVHLGQALSAMVTAAAGAGGQSVKEPVEIVVTTAGTVVEMRVFDAAADAAGPEVERLLDPPATTEVRPSALWVARALAQASGGDLCYERAEVGRPSFVLRLPTGS